MRLTSSSLLVLTASLLVTSAHAQDGDCQSCGDDVNFVDHSQIGAMSGGGGFIQDQLYPYDQQDTWLHGQYQRVPSYGGYNSFRPHNYRHVVQQSQIAANWGATEGLSYSQQFYNRYRTNFINGGLHSRRIQQSPPSYVILPSPTDRAVMRNLNQVSASRQILQHNNAAAASLRPYQRR